MTQSILGNVIYSCQSWLIFETSERKLSYRIILLTPHFIFYSSSRNRLWEDPSALLENCWTEIPEIWKSSFILWCCFQTIYHFQYLGYWRNIKSWEGRNCNHSWEVCACNGASLESQTNAGILWRRCNDILAVYSVFGREVYIWKWSKVMINLMVKLFYSYFETQTHAQSDLVWHHCFKLNATWKVTCNLKDYKSGPIYFEPE